MLEYELREETFDLHDALYIVSVCFAEGETEWERGELTESR
jgi:hypothetical protein